MDASTFVDMDINQGLGVPSSRYLPHFPLKLKERNLPTYQTMKSSMNDPG
jgi:hypothetical protein